VRRKYADTLARPALRRAYGKEQAIPGKNSHGVVHSGRRSLAFNLGSNDLAPASDGGGFWSRRGRSSGRSATAGACTIFTAAYGETVLFGNNEDYINPNTYYWVVPGSGAGNYGCIFFGFDNFYPQGGINEKGLAYDANALRPTPMNPHPELPRNPGRNLERLLRKCATVEEALKWYKQ
jgi:hypothetical protein